MVALAGVARLDHQADLGPGLLPDQVVVDGPGEQQGRDRRQLAVGGGGLAVAGHAPVGQHHDAGPVLDRG